jgi:predicted DNA binding CopG/RHH family protein
MRYVKSLDEIPDFKTEAEESEFWSTHSLAEIWDQLEPIEIEVSPTACRVTLQRTRKKPVTLRLEERQIALAKQLARATSLSYQALMRSWISEGIAREESERRKA